MVASKQLKLAVEIEKKKEEQDWRMMQLPNGSGWPRRWRKKRKARLEKTVGTTQLMLALIKGVVNVDVVLSLKPILKFGNYAYHSNLMFIGTHN